MKPDAPKLDPRKQLYRVVLGEEIIGQFSNLRLARDSAHYHRASVVLVYQNGKWIKPTGEE
jgi:hypothetical protein